MDLLHLVDRLEELVAGAQKMPIGNRAILDRRRLLDIVDQMRIAVPQEVREAQDIVAHRDAMRREAEEEGRILLAQAEERAARLVEAHEIAQAARRRAEEIATEAEARLEERIAAASFLSSGCPASIATSSVATEMVTGRTAEEAEALTRDDYAAAVGGLPKSKVHCSVLAAAAVRNAVAQWREQRRGDA